MRIHDQNPAGPGPAGGLGPTASRGSTESRPVAGAGSGPASLEAARQAAAGPDRVSLSNLAASLGPVEAGREAELDRLAELFQQGLYEPDPGVVAENLIDEGLANLSEPSAGDSAEG